MNRILSVFRIAWIEVWNNLRSIKGGTVILTLLFFIHQELKDIVSFADMNHCSIEFALLPYLHLRVGYTLIFAISVLYYYSDVPFLSKDALYQLMRMGKKWWLFTKICYIFFGAILLMGVEMLLSIIVCVPYLSFTGNWGAFWNTLSLTKTLDISFPRNIVILYSPISAQMRVCIVGILVVAFMGLIQFAITLFLGNKYAIIICGIIACGPVLAANSEYANIYYFSPVSWIAIVEHSVVYTYTGPNISYMFGFLFALIVLFIALIRYRVMRMDM